MSKSRNEFALRAQRMYVLARDVMFYRSRYGHMLDHRDSLYRRWREMELEAQWLGMREGNPTPQEFGDLFKLKPPGDE